ncbi:MAG: hypothetical protein ACREQ2_14360 [Candidatus Binatia bacterium]
MPSPGDYKTVQARILAYAQEIGWTFVPRAEAERRRGFDPDGEPGFGAIPVLRHIAFTGGAVKRMNQSFKDGYFSRTCGAKAWRLEYSTGN